jgi:hypothetical protein
MDFEPPPPNSVFFNYDFLIKNKYVFFHSTINGI